MWSLLFEFNMNNKFLITLLLASLTLLSCSRVEPVNKVEAYEIKFGDVTTRVNNVDEINEFSVWSAIYNETTTSGTLPLLENEIIAEVNSTAHSSNTSDDIKQLTLAQKPKSAIEYGYNKNKRDADGNVILNGETGWYLPAIDEAEEIMMSQYTAEGKTYYSYARFSDFQDGYKHRTKDKARVRCVRKM